MCGCDIYFGANGDGDLSGNGQWLNTLECEQFRFVRFGKIAGESINIILHLLQLVLPQGNDLAMLCVEPL